MVGLVTVTSGKERCALRLVSCSHRRVTDESYKLWGCGFKRPPGEILVWVGGVVMFVSPFFGCLYNRIYKNKSVNVDCYFLWQCSTVSTGNLFRKSYSFLYSLWKGTSACSSPHFLNHSTPNTPSTSAGNPWSGTSAQRVRGRCTHPRKH